MIVVTWEFDMLGLVLNILQLRRTLLEINEWITWYKIPDLNLKHQSITQ